MLRTFKSNLVAALALATSVSLAACGGGGGGLSTPTPPVAPAKAVSKTAVSFKIVLAAAPTSSGVKTASIKPLYVSPNTASLQIAVTDPSSTVSTFNFDVTGTSAGCATDVNGVVTCSETASVPVGADTFTVTAFSGAGETGSQLSVATLAQTIVVNSANVVNLTLNGIVSSLSVGFSIGSVNGNHGAKTVGVVVSPFDASGAFIFGSAAFTQPITLSADATSAPYVTFSKTTLTSPADFAGLDFVYDGTYPLSQIVVTAAASGATSGNGTLPVTAPPLPMFAPNPLSFNATGTSYDQALTVSEADYSGSWMESDTCLGIATTTLVTSPQGYNVSPIAAGTCSITMTDSYGNAASVPVSVTSTTFTVNSVGKHK